MHPIQTDTLRRARARDRRVNGFALIGAIAMLALFAMLGTAYVRYMMIELYDTRQHLDRIRAQHLASGGIYAAIGEIESALSGKQVPDGQYAISANVYRYEGGERVAYEQDIQVSVSDESARVNVNHAPPEVLRDLGLDDEAIEKLAKALPTRSGLRSDSRSWLNNVDELLTRGIVNRRQFDELDTGLFTIYTVEDPAKPAGFININSAAPSVLAAIFGIEDANEIETLAASRPFESWPEVLTKTGREPSTFNVAPPRYATDEMPSELALSSRCFRLRSEVSMNYRGAGGRGVSAAVEAVVLFKEDGSYAIRFWNEHPDFQRAAPTSEEETPDDSQDDVDTASSDNEADETAP